MWSKDGTEKKYRQLKFEIDELQDHYEMVVLRFKLRRHEITGLLNGSVTDWIFESDSAAFLKIIPSGKLCKYAFWGNGLPKQLNEIYKGVLGAALKAGYNLIESEEISA